MKKPAVFLDRDGTIIHDVGDISSPSQVVFFDETLPALLMLKENFELFIVTNQSGIAKGNITWDQANTVNAYVVCQLAEAGIPIREVYLCPHKREQNCLCIKPNPYFLLKARDEYGLNLQASYCIGDHPHDVQLAQNAGATGIYVLTGHGAKHKAELQKETIIVPNLLTAAVFIIAEGGNRP